MSKLNLGKLQAISSCAAEVLSALSGDHEEIHKDNSTRMCSLWDALNDHHAPPEIVKAMADELINLRNLKQMQRSQRIADRRRFSNPAPQEMISLLSKEPTNEQ